MSNVKITPLTNEEVANKLLEFLGKHSDKKTQYDGLLAALNFIQKRTEDIKDRELDLILAAIKDFESDDPGTEL